ncbi:HAMP domain-containing sensor histidine kinase [Streptomyces caniscabiei]|uniref:sensor histidine kinase n=1 Tax=Streptomyces caniscabiei TaxID=2746961 RepID=UPI00299FF82A|nr:HAMP domain-containing sensor histidine kinase [Streptomyces caniscabiei]MDX2776112.1 HAMP domain-containing sensor histidine kinase [Streptomyces caniscabiei]
MGIKKPFMVRDYWPRFGGRATLLVLLFQVIAVLLTGCMFMALQLYVHELPLYATLLILFGIVAATNLILFRILLSPLREITSALAHISGEPTSVTPPNPNAQRFERDGLRPVLQLIYKLASGDTQPKPELAKLSTDLSEALNNAGVGFIILGDDHKVTFANNRAPVHTDMDGNTIIDLIFEDEDNLYVWLKECEENAVHAERTWQRVANKIIGEEGRKIYDITASYHKGSQAEAVITLFDRTGMYLPEDEDLDFIAFAAHELRGPITVIRGYLDVLSDELDGKLEDDQVELMKRLVVSANRLGSYVNNILNASRYDRRHLKMHLRESSVADIYETIDDDMKLRAASQNRVLSVHFPDDLPTIAADRASISEVFSNLIDNAIKYSNEGGIVNVTARVDGDFVTIAVEDHGIGMPGSVVSNLFHKFYRSHRSRETVAGTGIGLYICKAIVESHGGHISVRSTEGEGSTFEFSLPVYATVEDTLKANNNSNEGLIEHDETGWIKNHAMYRG